MSGRTPDGYIDTDAYLQVRPDVGYYSGKIDGASVVRHTQTKPSSPMPGTLLMKITLRIPKAAFAPLEPEAVVVIPESMTEVIPMVEAVDPREEESDGP